MACPLSSRQLSDLRNALYDLNQMRPGLELLAQAGGDVDELRLRMEHLTRTAKAILSEYGVEEKT